MKTIGVLISGRGSNMVALIDAVERGELPGVEVGLVISNVPEADGIGKAKERGVPTIVLDHRGRKREEHDQSMAAALKERGIDLICLAGYMRLLSPWFIREFPLRILNIHPSLLPAFPGLHVHEQALEYGVKYSGCTVHFVDEELDHGAIVKQAVVEVHDSDTPEALAARILREEHRTYPAALKLIASGRYRIEGRRVIEIL